MKHRTPAYWPTRVLLVASILATVAVVLCARLLIDPPCFGCEHPNVLGLPSNVVNTALAVGLAVFGLVWMIRICRGPRDEPPPWRYRDR